MTPYYQDDSCTIYHGDFLSINVQANAIVTDPPYGVGKKYGESYSDKDGPAYWEWFHQALTRMREAAPTVAFTHRIAGLRHIEGWDWVGAWNKPRAMSGLNSMPVMPHWEPIFLFGLIGRDDLCRRFDVISANPAPASQHPCPKPVGLMRELVLWLTKDTDIVLDPFMGSGTTLRAAKDLGRKAIGIEIEERYCEIAANRLAQEVLAL